MAYSAVVRRLLISCPGDVPLSDLAIVQRTINRWNGLYGYQMTAAVIPISWGTHAAAQFGKPPQQIINSQLVDDCDICIAIFSSRIGTSTDTAESGTAEEIARIAERGGYVGILRSRRSIDPTRIDGQQVSQLNDYLRSLEGRCLILEYDNDMDLAAHVDSILLVAVSRDKGQTEQQLQQAAPARVAEVWPRIEREDDVRTDARGRAHTSRNWFLVLQNTGNAPARNVKISMESKETVEDPDPWGLLVGLDDPNSPIADSLAPAGEIRLRLFLSMGSPISANVTVIWEDERGKQSNVATVRTA